MVNYEELKKVIINSSSIEELIDYQKPPIPTCSQNQNYVFISYSHKDYKAVYCDLLELHRAGVRYWYDFGLPAGENWDEIVEKKIKGPGCAGVIFYISESLFMSPSVMQELDFTLKGNDDNGGRKYFGVNLSGTMPTQILKNIIRKYDDRKLNEIGFNDRIGDLPRAFSDRATFINKVGAANIRHIPETVRQIENQFNVIARAQIQNIAQFTPDISQEFPCKDGVLLRYLGNDSEVIIPHGVVTIGHEAFRGCALSRVIIPDTVLEISSGAFSCCQNLYSFHIPDSVKGIGEYAFEGCSNLRDITISNITEIRDGAFMNCSELAEISISSVLKVGKHAFYGCTNLEKVELPYVTQIGEYAFAECTNLNSIYIPEVLSIEDGVFKNCTGLRKINLPNATAAGNHSFSGCSNMETIEIPKVKIIGKFAFSDCICLRYINANVAKEYSHPVIPDLFFVAEIFLPDVISVSEYAFYNCTKIRSIDLTCLAEVTEAAFSRCSSLENVYTPNVGSIGDEAFSICSSLENIYAPNVKSIGKGAFLQCIHFNPDISGVTVILEDAFRGCENLKDVVFSEEIEKIENGSFINCKNLKRLVIPVRLWRPGMHIASHWTKLVYTGTFLERINRLNESIKGGLSLKE